MLPVKNRFPNCDFRGGQISQPLVLWLIYIYIYQSQNLTVASARNWRVCRQGRRGQGSRRQGRGRHGWTGQGRGTYQKRTEQKQSRAWAKSKAGHDGHCAIWISKCAGQGQNAEQGKKGQNKVSRFRQLWNVASLENNYSRIYNSSKLASN